MKKALNTIGTVATWLLMAVAVCMMIFTVLSVKTFDNTGKSLFGYKAFIVLSDSMSATDFSAGDLVLIRDADVSTLQAGDIIAFQSQNEESYGEIVTHKIRKRAVDENGNPGYITYGTTTGVDDSAIVTYSFVIGKYQSRLKGVGKFFRFMKTVPGYICCIFIPFFLLILIEGIRVFRLFRAYRQEQVSALESERAALEKERQEQKDMMAELLALKAQLAAAAKPDGTGSEKSDSREESAPEKS